VDAIAPELQDAERNLDIAKRERDDAHDQLRAMQPHSDDFGRGYALGQRDANECAADAERNLATAVHFYAAEQEESQRLARALADAERRLRVAEAAIKSSLKVLEWYVNETHTNGAVMRPHVKRAVVDVLRAAIAADQTTALADPQAQGRETP
jgi:hypothetical protein